MWAATTCPGGRRSRWRHGAARCGDAAAGPLRAHADPAAANAPPHATHTHTHTHPCCSIFKPQFQGSGPGSAGAPARSSSGGPPDAIPGASVADSAAVAAATAAAATPASAASRWFLNDRIASLREAFRRTPKWLGFNIELKCAGSRARVARGRGKGGGGLPPRRLAGCPRVLPRCPGLRAARSLPSPARRCLHTAACPLCPCVRLCCNAAGPHPNPPTPPHRTPPRPQVPHCDGGGSDARPVLQPQHLCGRGAAGGAARCAGCAARPRCQAARCAGCAATARQAAAGCLMSGRLLSAALLAASMLAPQPRAPLGPLLCRWYWRRGWGGASSSAPLTPTAPRCSA